jgi:hypothetical protein
MSQRDREATAVDRFIFDQIDSVPHLEALLLIWSNNANPWSAEEVGRRLYISPQEATKILNDLTRQQLLQPEPSDPQRYGYHSQSKEADELMDAINRTYLRETVRISTMIHAKASPAVRDFARAFRFKKERD